MALKKGMKIYFELIHSFGHGETKKVKFRGTIKDFTGFGKQDVVIDKDSIFSEQDITKRNVKKIKESNVK